MKKIIDVSSYQGEIDWEAIKPYIDGAIVRAGLGHNNIDKYFERNIKECNRLGIPVGVYWFSYAYTDEMALNEAKYCHAAIKPYKLQLPVYYDWEYDSMDYARKCGKFPGKKEITNWNKIWCDYFRSQKISYGYYLNYDYSVNYIDRTKLSGSEWYAFYTSKEKTPKGNYDIWQYGTERYVGINGAVDTNYVFNESIFKNGVAPAPIPATKKGYSGPWPTIPNTIFRKSIRKNDKGDNVYKLQKFLLWFDPKCLPLYGADGDFGDETERAVKAFQKASRIKEDGWFGNNSLNAAKAVRK